MEKDYKIGNCPACGKFISSFNIHMPKGRSAQAMKSYRLLELIPCGCKTYSWETDKNGLFVANSAPSLFVAEANYPNYQI